MSKVKALIFDFGNDLCTWTPPRDCSITPPKLKQIMSSDIWFDYERGRYASPEQRYRELEDCFAVHSSDLGSVLQKARGRLRMQTETSDFLAKLRQKRPDLKLYGLTNTPLPEQDYVHSIARRWPVFDKIYISGSLGMRKPDFYCYRTVLLDIGLPAEAVVFVDDLAENIFNAHSLWAFPALCFRVMKNSIVDMKMH